MNEVSDLVIVGAGPAGLTAGLYAGRSRLKAVIIERENLGGALVNIDWIENYPGYPDGIRGAELAAKMMTPIMNYGVEMELAEVTGMKLCQDHIMVQTTRCDYLGKAVIIASGVHVKKLNVPGEAELTNSGVFYCGTCDGPRYANKVVAVAGAGNSGVSDAIYLTKLASKVIVIAKYPRLRCDKVLEERALANPNVEVKYTSQITRIKGDGKVEAIELLNSQTGQKDVLGVDGVLVRSGIVANSDLLKECSSIGDKGQVFVNENMETDVPGVFAAGDVRHGSALQIASAVGDGVTAARSVSRYLQSLAG